jgi:fructokinase
MGNPEIAVRVVTAGEALVDLVEQADGSLVPCAGGSVFNFTRALAAQGVGTGYLNPLSRDQFGRLLAGTLEQGGVVLAAPQPVAQPTALAVVSVDTAGQPEYSFHREGVADRAIDAAGLVAETKRWSSVEAVCTGCLALAPQDSDRYLPWLRECRDAGIAVVVDANLRPSVMADDAAAWRASVGAALALADVIKVSEEDLRHLLPESGDPVRAAAGLFALGPAQLVALTLGGEGALLLARDGRGWLARDTADVQVADTVGAGDCFLAGLVAGLLDEGGLRQRTGADIASSGAARALARAVVSASHCVQQRGCVPPHADEVARALALGTVRVEGLQRSWSA